ncbi:hypothetical protein BURPS1106B_0569 [Burkholderia pseudomallei 1106b]|uniref:Uncharacterized protein n=2 Tax=Burkholderia pseudomallei TaxID=28450 RepID=A0A0E1W184_BURPE|nr:hypothetical protein BURPS668_A1507 [Burkholderia pseudomallei 668]ABN94076.1 hypothetical protein BURPS1106A_A1420 [Burkholderia pseudomallei 1106a]EES21339.1 hypothetical protein BURPS1106B_0569 [Burkholderia pseudomallei 1106b]EET03407.1 hypothetical protein BURPS1710A_A0584 [Burkholderia pseudomallei 1710a]
MIDDSLTMGGMQPSFPMSREHRKQLRPGEKISMRHAARVRNRAQSRAATTVTQ